jgi:predicted unusual protein kinase regulating ubiquinone biosynthesis (AarF/ABC1/UbiB family)
MTKGTLPTGRIGRSARLAGLAGRTVASQAHTRLRGHARSEASREADWARQARLSRRYFEVMGGMKGAAMKAGQILSFINGDALLPAAHHDLLQSWLIRLQDDMPPLGLEEITAVIQSELGAPPDRLFAFFSPEPIAAASIGQVHLARVHDGTELAIKVQYPGVADAVRADLANTGLFAAVLAKALPLLGPQAPRLDLKLVAEEVRDRVGDELDYRIEAANQQQFHRLYHDHPFIRIPAVHPEFSSGRVLATDYVHGRRWSDARAAGERLRGRWGETIFRFVFTSLYQHGLFNADPTPGTTASTTTAP